MTEDLIPNSALNIVFLIVQQIKKIVVDVENWAHPVIYIGECTHLCSFVSCMNSQNIFMMDLVRINLIIKYIGSSNSVSHINSL